MSSGEEIKSDIERARAELAETAGAIAAKFDVKAQAERHPNAWRAAFGAAAAVALALLLRRVVAHSAARSSAA